MFIPPLLYPSITRKTGRGCSLLSWGWGLGFVINFSSRYQVFPNNEKVNFVSVLFLEKKVRIRNP